MLNYHRQNVDDCDISGGHATNSIHCDDDNDVTMYVGIMLIMVVAPKKK